LGMDVPATAEAANALLPSARAKVGVRLAPGDEPDAAFEAVAAHLRARVPWGAQVEITADGTGAPFALDTSGPVYDVARGAFRDAWDGVDPVEIGIGGSIPFIATFAEMFPKATILVTGVEDPRSQAHGPNESLHLGEFARVCLDEALLLHRLGQ